MASPSLRETHVSIKPYPCQYFPHCLLYIVIAYTSLKGIRNKYTHKSNIKGAIQRYEIVQNAIRPPIKPKANPILTMRHIILIQTQDLDQDMTDSSSPANNKRGQLSLYLPSQQKKTRNATQTEHDRYANQDLWLGFPLLELIAQDNEVPPPQAINILIRELLRLGFWENEAAEMHTTRISFPRVQPQRWPNKHTDDYTGHHYHLTQVPLDVEINPNTSFALVYYILLNFEKSTIAFTSQEIIDMTKTRL
jgi:hypothetical protein